jgi:hypothetical protein
MLKHVAEESQVDQTLVWEGGQRIEDDTIIHDRQLDNILRIKYEGAIGSPENEVD